MSCLHAGGWTSMISTPSRCCTASPCSLVLNLVGRYISAICLDGYRHHQEFQGTQGESEPLVSGTANAAKFCTPRDGMLELARGPLCLTLIHIITLACIAALPLHTSRITCIPLRRSIATPSAQTISRNLRSFHCAVHDASIRASELYPY